MKNIQHFLLGAILLLFSNTLLAQNGVGINTDNSNPDASALLDVKSTTQGVLVPRMTDAEKTAIPVPATGLLIFQTDGAAGFWYYDGSAWQPISEKEVSAINLGDMKYWNGTNWVILPVGKSGSMLKLVNDVPTWEISTVQPQLDAGYTPCDIINQGYPVDSLIGKLYAGGMIFYFDNATCNGLVASLNDQGAHSFGCAGTNLPGAEGVLIGTGNQNTIDIEAGCATVGTSTDIAANLTEQGYSDWFLPSKDELNEMYLKIGPGAAAPFTNIGGFNPTGSYATSSEVDANNYWRQQFDNSGQVSVSKFWVSEVRPIRVFDGAVATPFELPSTNSGWSLTGNTGTVNGTDFIGTTDAQDLDIRTNNILRTRITQKGQIEVLNTGGSVFIGQSAGANDDLTNNHNTAIGAFSLFNNVAGLGNTAIGYSSLINNTANYNTAVGNSALQANTSGQVNTAFGAEALYWNTTGGNNNAFGNIALFDNTTGSSNASFGNASLQNNTTGNNNAAFGVLSLDQNIAGNNNTATGTGAGYNALGNGNVFLGFQAGYNETGSDKLYIDNSNTANPLIYGDFATNQIDINGRMEIPTSVDASGTAGSGSLEIGNSLRIDGDEIITNNNTILNLQNGNNGDLRVDGGTLTVDASTNRVGIGTATPTTGKLHVVGNGIIFNNTNAGRLLNGGVVNAFTGTNSASIYASGRVCANSFYTFSDARIKNVIGISNSSEDLLALSKIKITDYHMKDSLSYGQKIYKKVIAQELAQVYPLAVNFGKDFIPNIYQASTINNGWIVLKTTLKTGSILKVITKDGEQIVSVLEAQKDRFKINLEDGAVFVFGEQVDDFHSVDYEALTTLNISATQAQQKTIEALETENAALKAELETLRLGQATLKSQVDEIKALLNQTANNK